MVSRQKSKPENPSFTVVNANILEDSIGFVFLAGSEDFFAKRTVEQVKKTLLARDENLEVHTLDAATYEPGQLFTLASASLFESIRLLNVDNGEKTNDAFLSDLETFARFDNTLDIVITVRYRGGTRAKKIFDQLCSDTAWAKRVLCTPLVKDYERVQFVQHECSTVQRSIRPAAARALVQALPSDLQSLSAGIQQLLSDTDKEITEEVVSSYYLGHVEGNVFHVLEAALSGDQASAMIALRQAQSSHISEVNIVAVFAAKLRLMAKIYGRSNHSSGALAKEFGCSSWQIENARRSVRTWKQEGLVRCIQEAAHTDALVKGAGRDAGFALEIFVRCVCAKGFSFL